MVTLFGEPRRHYWSDSETRRPEDKIQAKVEVEVEKRSGTAPQSQARS